MAKLLRGALVGALALTGVAIASTETMAMPVDGLASSATQATAPQVGIDKVYWRYGYGWHRPWGYGWRRPWGFGVRPFGWRPYRYGFGWHRGWRRW